VSPVIHLEGVARRFGPVAAVDGVDLAVDPGRILALLGPSGCGKTTLLRVLAGFEQPDAGTVHLGGRVVADGATSVAAEDRRVGMVFQDFALFPHLDVARNVGFGLGRWGGGRVGMGRHRDRVREVLELVGLVGLEHRLPAELSGGQQQRVALARALAPRPEVVLLDEPFSNLDAALRAQVRTDLVRILRSAAVTAILVTHDQEEALSVADEVAVMRAGRIVQRGTPEALYHRPHDRETAAFVGDVEFLPGEGAAGGVRTELGTLGLAQAVVGPVDVMVRPEALRLVPDPAGPALVETREFYGHDQMLWVRLPSGRRVRARCGPATPVEVGGRCHVEVDGDVRVFAS